MIEHMWIAFPLVPLCALVLSMGITYLLRYDISSLMLRISACIQVVLAILVTIWGVTEEVRFINLSYSPLSIVFLIEEIRYFFLWAYIVPLLFSLKNISSLPNKSMTMVLFFYQVGCSGLIVTGDMFNFFVFYELMVMAAYVLIGIKGKFFASIKYMIFGSVSSILFLGGIVCTYLSNVNFALYQASLVSKELIPIFSLGIGLCLVAFLIKGAFFPFSGWVAPCHTAANALVSSFLASFTICTGVLGIYNFVCIPAWELSLEWPIIMVRVISLITVGFGAITLFWETSFKRVIAHSTIFTMGIVTLMVSYGYIVAAGLYIVIHAVYKTSLFYLYEEGKEDLEGLSFPLYVLITLPILIYVASGMFPSPTCSLKSVLAIDAPYIVPYVCLFGGFLVIGGFAKFSYKRVKAEGFSILPLSLLLLILATTRIWQLYPLSMKELPSIAIEYIGVAIMIFVSRKIVTKFPIFHNIERKTLYKNLHQELFVACCATGIIMMMIVFIG